MKVIFFGSSRYVVPVLDMLNREHTVILVATTELGNQEPVKFYCHTKKIPCITVRKAVDLTLHHDIQRANADLGIVADFGIIIQEKFIHSFPKGMINIHPSLLPLYRGPTPVQTAILNGEKTTGVSIIQLDKLMDHGPILAQKEEIIDPDDTAKSLYEKLFKESAQLLSEVLHKFEHNNTTPIAQDDNKATFTKFLTREDGFVDLSKPEVDRKLKAYYPWPGTWTKLPLNQDGQARIIKLLPDNKIQVEGGKEMKYKDFMNGYPQADKKLLDFLRKAETNG